MYFEDTPTVYEELGAKRVVNAMGSTTILGGSILGPKVRQAMDLANVCFVDMEELLDKSGRAIAELIGAEAAYVTPGCFAALVLGAAAIMTGGDPEKVARLPDTTGMKSEFLIQKCTRYHYDRCVTVPGGKLIEVGHERGTSAQQLEAAIGPETAGILYLARAEGSEGTLTLNQVLNIARRKGVAVLVDAAAEVYPLERMTGLAKSGADLLCFGGKYFGSTNSSGLLCGRKDMVKAAALNGFIAYEAQVNRCLGRGYKLDRQEIVATVVALREWFAMDHEERFRVQEERLQVIAQALEGLPHVSLEGQGKRQGPWIRLRIGLDEARLGKTAETVGRALREGDPSIWVWVEGSDILVTAHNLRDGEDKMVAARLRELLAG